MKRAFRVSDSLNIIVAKTNISSNIVKDIKRRQMISTIVGVLLVEPFICMYMILANSVLGLQEESKECKRRNPIGSDRLALILFPISLAANIAFWMLIYSHIMSKRRDTTLKGPKREPVPLVLPESSLISQ